MSAWERCSVFIITSTISSDFFLHAKHLEDTFGVGPHTISVPRVCPADDVDLTIFHDTIPDETFKKIVAVLRVAVPYTGLIVSTRESKASRTEVLKIGISQISGGSITGIGGYAKGRDETAQFDVTDTRTLDQVMCWLCEEGYVPSFCTACYREGRTGDRFMQFAKSGQICNFCQPNALLTLKRSISRITRRRKRKRRFKRCGIPRLSVSKKPQGV